MIDGPSTTYALAIAPEYLGAFRQWLAGCTDALDELRQIVRANIKELYLDKCSPAFLVYHGALRNLPRLSRETAEAYRAALYRCFDAWIASGTDEELVRQVARLGLSARVVTFLDLWLAGVPTAFGGVGVGDSFWFLVISWPLPGPQPRRAKWDDGTKWDDGAVWDGAGFLPGDIQELISVIYKFKPAHTSCRFIVVALESAFRLGPKFEFTGLHAIYPVNEPWEIAPDFTVSPYYNGGFDRP